MNVSVAETTFHLGWASCSLFRAFSILSPKGLANLNRMKRLPMLCIKGHRQPGGSQELSTAIGCFVGADRSTRRPSTNQRVCPEGVGDAKTFVILKLRSLSSICRPTSSLLVSVLNGRGRGSVNHDLCSPQRTAHALRFEAILYRGISDEEITLDKKVNIVYFFDRSTSKRPNLSPAKKMQEINAVAFEIVLEKALRR